MQLSRTQYNSPLTERDSLSARWLLWNFRHLYLPHILVPPYFGRLCRVVDDDGDGGIVDGHEGGVLEFPCHHGFPHEGAFLGVDGLLCVPLFTMTGLDLYEIEDAGALGDLFQETGENTWTARVSSGEGCHVSVKYYNGYYNESLWYHAEPSGEMASLTLAQATEDPADMLELPAGTWILTLEGNEAGGYTLRYEETDPLCSVNGDITNWDTVEMALNSEGVYTYSTRIEPYMSWSGTFEFYFTLNGKDYSANAMIFDKIEGLALAPMDS